MSLVNYIKASCMLDRISVGEDELDETRRSDDVTRPDKITKLIHPTKFKVSTTA